MHWQDFVVLRYERVNVVHMQVNVNWGLLLLLLPLINCQHLLLDRMLDWATVHFVVLSNVVWVVLLPAVLINGYCLRHPIILIVHSHISFHVLVLTIVVIVVLTHGLVIESIQRKQICSLAVCTHLVWLHEYWKFELQGILLISPLEILDTYLHQILNCLLPRLMNNVDWVLQQLRMLACRIFTQPIFKLLHLVLDQLPI
jgi:hypothetical protein